MRLYVIGVGLYLYELPLLLWGFFDSAEVKDALWFGGVWSQAIAVFEAQNSPFSVDRRSQVKLLIVSAVGSEENECVFLLLACTHVPNVLVVLNCMDFVCLCV